MTRSMAYHAKCSGCGTSTGWRSFLATVGGALLAFVYVCIVIAAVFVVAP